MPTEKAARTATLLLSMGAKLSARPIPAQLEARAIMLDYQRALEDVIARAVAAFAIVVLRALPDLVRTSDAEQARRVVADAYARMTSALQASNVDQLIARYAVRASKFGREQLTRQVKAALGVPIEMPDGAAPKLLRNFVAENLAVVYDVAEKLSGDVEKLLTRKLSVVRVDAIKDNIRLIKSLPPGVDKTELGNAIERAVAGGESSSKLARELVDKFDLPLNKAKTIARDQIGKLNGQLNAARQQELGITKFRWRTREDNKVRPKHKERNRKVYGYEAPPAGNLPGEEPNCRCWPEPVFEDLLGDITPKQARSMTRAQLGTRRRSR